MKTFIIILILFIYFYWKLNITSFKVNLRNCLAAFVGIPEIIQHMRFNYAFWKTLNDRGITSMSKVYCPEILDDLPSSPRNEYLNEILESDFKLLDSCGQKNESEKNDPSFNEIVDNETLCQKEHQDNKLITDQ